MKNKKDAIADLISKIDGHPNATLICPKCNCLYVESADECEDCAKTKLVPLNRAERLLALEEEFNSLNAPTKGNKGGAPARGSGRKSILGGLALLTFMSGIFSSIFASTVFQQIIGGISFVVAAILFSAVSIIESIERIEDKLPRQ